MSAVQSSIQVMGVVQAPRIVPPALFVILQHSTFSTPWHSRLLSASRETTQKIMKYKNGVTTALFIEESFEGFGFE